MPWTQSDIDTLKAAIVARKGARTIAFSDQSVTFDSIAEMRELLGEMQREVNRTAGRPRVRYAATSKGT